MAGACSSKLVDLFLCVCLELRVLLFCSLDTGPQRGGGIDWWFRGRVCLLLRNLPTHSFSGQIVGISNQSSGQAPIQSYLSIFSLFFSSCSKEREIFPLANIRFLRPLFRSGGGEQMFSSSLHSCKLRGKKERVGSVSLAQMTRHRKSLFFCLKTATACIPMLHQREQLEYEVIF